MIGDPRDDGPEEDGQTKDAFGDGLRQVAGVLIYVMPHVNDPARWFQHVLTRGAKRSDATDRRSTLVTSSGTPTRIAVRRFAAPQATQDFPTLTCDEHAVTLYTMSKMMQIRNVPDAVHRTIKARAAQAGMTLSDYLLAHIEQITPLGASISTQPRARSL